MNRAIERLRWQVGHWGMKLNPSQESLLVRYAEILGGYRLANVIGTRNRDEIILEHLLDSLSCLTVEDLRCGGKLVDVGTGGGLPGIPLAIALPDCRVTLLEATEKKVRFLEHVRARLGLQNVDLIHARAEDAGRTPQYREAFELATARALAGLPVVVEYCAPLVQVEGAIVAMKGRLSEDELTQGVAASSELGVVLREVREVKYRHPFPQKERRLVVLDKVRTTPDRFPRRVGLAKKRPLGTRARTSSPTQNP